MYQIEALRSFSSNFLKKGFFSNRVVFFIGLTSLLTDLATEMVASIMPNFLYSTLMLPPLLVGLFDGLYQGFAAIIRLPAGYWTDRMQAHRSIAFAGYVFSCVAKLLLLLAIPFGLLMALLGLALDRIGKAIRTAPRDHLIAMHSKEGQLGASFGMHRSMDAVGAFLGPIIAFLLLYLFFENYQIVVIFSIFFAAAGLFSFWFGIPKINPEKSNTSCDVNKLERPSYSLRKFCKSLLADRKLVIFLSFCFLLNIFVVGDGLLYLQLQNAGVISQEYLPLLFSGTALVFVLLAYPVGLIADRIGTFKPLISGFLVVVILYGALSAGWLTSTPGVFLILMGMGVFYATTDGVLVAQIVRFTDSNNRTTALAIFGALVGAARFFSSLLFGLLWQIWGAQTALIVFALGLMGVIVLFLFLFDSHFFQFKAGAV